MAAIGDDDWSRIYAFMYQKENPGYLDGFAHNPAPVVAEIAAKLGIPFDPNTLFDMLPTDLSPDQMKDLIKGTFTDFCIFMRLCC